MAKYFGDKSVWYPRTGIQNQHNVKCLQDLCSDCINSTYYPETILVCCICRIEHDLQFHDWKRSHQIPMGIYIEPIERHFQFFAYPEINNKRELVERRTFDPTHILTNMHAHICKKGFQNVHAEAFLEVGERNNDL